MNKYVLILLLLCPWLHAQEVQKDSYVSPFDFPLLLSANFGELRSNHFHGGLDFKTKGVENQPVHSIADGYVSRISISTGGYGNALYVTHEDGTLAVYGHLNKFEPAIADYVEQYQYEHETFVVDIACTPEQFPVKQGQRIALSGNTGYSFGPHLHLEIRRADTFEAIDPLPYYKKQIKDTRAPRAQKITFYPYKGCGVVDSCIQKKTFPVATPDKRNCLNKVVYAWGKIGMGITANDYMDGTTNTYGVRKVTLYQDTVQIFQSIIDFFPMAENCVINAWTDYAEYVLHNRWVMKSFLIPGNTLPMFSTGTDNGWITVDEERDYPFMYELEDLHGNCSRYRFVVRGKRMEIPEVQMAGRRHLDCNRPNVVQEAGMQLLLPRGVLYEDVDLFTKVSPDTSGVSLTYTIHDEPLPFHSGCELQLGVRHPVEADSAKYYIQRRVGKKYVSAGGVYAGGWVKTEIRQGGIYRVGIDKEAPVLTPMENSSPRIFRYRVRDEGTGIKSWRGTIDGQFALVAFSAKNGVMTCELDRKRIAPGKHRFELSVTDYAGNVSTVSRIINL